MTRPGSIAIATVLATAVLLLLPQAIGRAASGLTAGYAFSEGAGTTTADASGAGLTGTLVNAPVWTTGRNGSGLSFNGSSSYIDSRKSGSAADHGKPHIVGVGLRASERR